MDTFLLGLFTFLVVFSLVVLVLFTFLAVFSGVALVNHLRMKKKG